MAAYTIMTLIDCYEQWLVLLLGSSARPGKVNSITAAADSNQVLKVVEDSRLASWYIRCRSGVNGQHMNV